MPASRHAEFLDQLPDDWEEVPFGEIGEIVGGGTPSRTNPGFWGGEIEWVTPGELTDLETKWLTETRERITRSGLKGSAARVLPANTLLITTRATIGSVALAAKPVATNQGFRSIVCNSSADPSFYYHLLRRIAPELKRLGSGSTFDEISKGDLSQIVVPRPTVDEQQMIASVLDRGDELAEETRTTIVKLERLRQGLRHDLLSFGLGADGKLRSVEDAGLKDSPCGPIPDSWEIPTLDEVIAPGAPICYGIVQPGAYDESGVPVLAIYNLNTDYRSGVHRVARSVESRYVRSRIRSGDVLLSIKGTIGRVGLVPDFFEGNISRDLARIRPRPDVSPRFLRHIFLYEGTQRRLSIISVGSTRLELSIWALRRFQIPLPDFDEQEKIAEVLDSVDARIQAEVDYERKVNLLKAGLAEDLLRGRVRVINGGPLLAGEPLVAGARK
jgi:type I restriction enzyme S subunit